MPKTQPEPSPQGDANAWYQRGVACLDSGLLDDAEGCFRAALGRDPRHAKAQVNLGVTLQRIGRADEAERCYRAAIDSAPGLAQAWFNLGTVRLGAENHSAALEPLAKAVQLDPSVAEWHAALATAQHALGRPMDAIASLQAAVRLDPRLAVAHDQLGICLLETGDAAGALAAFETASSLGPARRTRSSNRLFALNFLPDESPETICEEHLAWARELDEFPLPSVRRAESREGRRLRIAYLSPDFRSHSVSWFIQPVLAHHDRGRFEILCYSDAELEDEISVRLRPLVAAWHSTARLTNEQLAALIREHQVDILVDLAGHSAGGRRMPVLARKPAPVQVSWLGYLNTTGLKAVDYRITDRTACPEGMERYHTERLVRLPHCQWCFAPLLDSPAPQVAPPPAAREGVITFGSFHNLAKLTPPAIALWARLLREVPRSRLLVVARGAPQLEARIRQTFRAAGVEPERIACEGHVPVGAYLSLHGRVDINLDAFPYAGGTTTFHSLWMGVPVVTLAGRHVVSRGGASILGALGLGELVAASEEEHLRIAGALARDPERLARWRRELRGMLERSPLMDGSRFTRELEAAYLGMWEGHMVREDEALRLHIGGREPMRGWKILNVQPGPGVDYVGDCRDLSRFADGSVDEIYASHVIEHLDYSEGLPQALAEFRRVLNKGGNARIGVPDFEVLCRMFVSPDSTFEQRFGAMRIAFGGQVDEHDFHCVGLSFELLRDYLLEAGFTKVERTENFGLLVDDSALRLCGVPISLNVIAYK